MSFSPESGAKVLTVENGQLHTILSVIGTPSEEDIRQMSNEEALAELQGMEKIEPQVHTVCEMRYWSFSIYYDVLLLLTRYLIIHLLELYGDVSESEF